MEQKKAIYSLIGLAIIGILINSFFVFNFYNPGVIQEKINLYTQDSPAINTQEQSSTDNSNSQAQIIEDNSKSNANSNSNSAGRTDSFAYSNIDYGAQTNNANENLPPSTVIPPAGVVDSTNTLTEILPSEESAAPI